MEKLLDKKFSEFRNGDLAQLKEAIDSMKKAMAFISQQYDDIIITVHDLKRDKEFLMMENSALKTEVARLNCKTTELDASLDEAEQYNRRECLVIRGIPVT